MLARNGFRLILCSTVLALVACSDDNGRDEAVPEMDAHYTGQELVEELVFASDEHRDRHACLIETSRRQYEALVGHTYVNQSDNDASIVVSWCSMEEDAGSICMRGLGVESAWSPGDVGVLVTANVPTDIGEVVAYGYESRRVEDDANGWRSRLALRWDSAAPADDEPEFHFTFAQLIDSNIDLENSLFISLSPNGAFTSDDISYDTPPRYTLAELVDTLDGTEAELQSFFTEHLNAVQNDLEMQAINDVTLNESDRANYLNDLNTTFDVRREAVAAYGTVWRSLLLEQLQMAACDVGE